MSTKIKYIKATEEDIAVIAQLAESIWKKHYITIISMEQINFMLEKMYSSESLIQQMNAGHEFTLVSDDELPIGYYSLSTKDRKNYFLHKFYVETSNQSKGIGTEILAYLLKQLKTAASIELTVNRQNYKAINFYFKNGFVIQKTADFDIGNGYFMNDFVMVKNLSNRGVSK